MSSAKAVVNAPRPLRADAQRNRDAILSAARETFETEGVLASLDGIALRAGVGNATLYRNFPTRDDLLAAIISTGIDAAIADADELARAHSPREALSLWLQELTWGLRIWNDLPDCVASATSNDPESAISSVCLPLVDRTADFLSAAKATGDVPDTVTATEVFELVTALSWAVDRFHDDEQAARRRVAVATAGFFTAAR